LALVGEEGIVASGGGDWRRREGQAMAAGQVAVPVGASYEKKQPARSSDVRETAAYSAGSALVLAIAGFVFAVLAQDARVFIVFLILGVIAFVVLWFVLMWESRRLLWVVERITGRDLDGDGHQGQPKTNVTVSKTVRIALDDGKQVLYRESGLEDYEVERVAYAILDDDAPFSRRALCVEHNCFPAEIYGRVRALWIRAGLVAAVTEAANAAVDLTPAGEVFLRQCIGR
jgi:hypothetical protein